MLQAPQGEEVGDPLPQSQKVAPRLIEPPMIIAAAAWGDTVYLAHFLQLHFEGTAPTDAPRGN